MMQASPHQARFHTVAVAQIGPRQICISQISFAQKSSDQTHITENRPSQIGTR